MERGAAQTNDSTAIRAVSAAIDRYVKTQGAGPPLVLIDQATWHWAAGVLLQLQKAGAPFSVERDWLPMFTDAVTATGDERLAITIDGAERHFLNRDRPGNVVIAEHPPIFVDAVRVTR